MDRDRLDRELRKILALCKQFRSASSQPLNVTAISQHIDTLKQLGISSKRYESVIAGLKSLKSIGEEYQTACAIDDAVGAARVLEQWQIQCAIVADWVVELGMIECAWTKLE